MDQALTTLAQTIATLGAAGVLALGLMLWLRGDLHSKKEMDAQKLAYEERFDEYEAYLAYREQLRLEAVEDRRQADAQVDALTTVIKEGSELTRRTLDLNERLLDEVVGRALTRPRRGDQHGSRSNQDPI